MLKNSEKQRKFVKIIFITNPGTAPRDTERTNFCLENITIYFYSE